MVDEVIPVAYNDINVPPSEGVFPGPQNLHYYYLVSNITIPIKAFGKKNLLEKELIGIHFNWLSIRQRRNWIEATLITLVEKLCHKLDDRNAFNPLSDLWCHCQCNFLSLDGLKISATIPQ